MENMLPCSVLNNPTLSELNDYNPVAPISHVMNALERLLCNLHTA